MKIIQVININICKNWLLEKKRFLEIKRVGFSPKIWLFLFCNLGTGHYLCRGGEGGGENMLERSKFL